MENNADIPDRKANAIQKATTSTVKDIDRVREVIQDVNEFVISIASTSEEQSASTRKIAENVHQASSGIKEVNEKVSQSNTATSDIAREISKENSDAQQMTTRSAGVQEDAANLSSLAKKLQKLLQGFKI